MLIRQKSGSVKGYWNFCRHRGSQLLSGAGVCKSECITCPYHGWSYELSGELRKAPRFTDLEDFYKTDYSLSEIFVHEAAGLLFINLNSGEIADARFERLSEILSNYQSIDIFIIHKKVMKSIVIGKLISRIIRMLSLSHTTSALCSKLSVRSISS